MPILIKHPVYLNEQGGRSNNEDSIFPAVGTATVDQRLFLVCDGVGGASKGEVASKMTCEHFPEYFKEHSGERVNAAFIEAALRYTEEKMSECIAQAPAHNGMATTLTLLYLNDKNNTATIAWIGDSRIYQIRDGKILFVSEDHSLVNELVKRGELTEEQAATHPQRNMILRAIAGQDAPTQADVVHIKDVQAGDYFLLCTDGILESFDDATLVELLNDSSVDLETAKDKMHQICDMMSRDNFSMYLMQISELTAAPAGSTAVLDSDELKNVLKEQEDSEEKKTFGTAAKTVKTPSEELNKGDRKLLFFLGLFALLSLLALGIYKLSDLSKNNEEKLAQIEQGNIALLKQKADGLIASGLLDSLRLAKQPIQDAITEYESVLAGSPGLKERIDERVNSLKAQRDEVDGLISRSEVNLNFVKEYRSYLDSVKLELTAAVAADTNKSFNGDTLLLLESQLDSLAYQKTEVIESVSRLIPIKESETPDEEASPDSSQTESPIDTLNQ